MNVLKVLEERGFIEQMTDKALLETISSQQAVYCGFDPTGESLHVGHLVPIFALAWFQRFGHPVVALVGGATGMIGDPSGKSQERNLLDEETIARNLQGIAANLGQILSFSGENAACCENNASWFKEVSLIPFLREVGKLFRMGPMLSKESVKVRIQSEEGMSFTEFCYQILQGYDFLHLYQTKKVEIQLGGSDQWGNITAGTELVRKVEGTTVYGVTFPLLTRSDGKKFGKTEEGAVWLTKEKTSPYAFYQYFVQVPDNDVVQMMKLLTFMSLEEIASWEKKMKEACYLPNSAQKVLAEHVTLIVHGEQGLNEALETTALAKPGKEADLSTETLESLKGTIPTLSLDKTKSLGLPVIDLLVALKIQQSKGEARRLIKNSGLYINNASVKDDKMLLSEDLFIDGRFFLVSLGKKKRYLVESL